MHRISRPLILASFRQRIWIVRILFKNGRSAEGDGAPVLYPANQCEANSVTALLASREPALGKECGGVHQAVRLMLNAINAACGNGVTRFKWAIFHWV